MQHNSTPDQFKKVEKMNLKGEKKKRYEIENENRKRITKAILNT